MNAHDPLSQQRNKFTFPWDDAAQNLLRAQPFERRWEPPPNRMRILNITRRLSRATRIEGFKLHSRDLIFEEPARNEHVAPQRNGQFRAHILFGNVAPGPA